MFHENPFSAVPENGCLIFLVDEKKTKKNIKNICKTYTLLPHRRLRKLERIIAYLCRGKAAAAG